MKVCENCSWGQHFEKSALEGPKPERKGLMRVLFGTGRGIELDPSHMQQQVAEKFVRCKRYPEAVLKQKWDHCGEWKSKTGGE